MARQGRIELVGDLAQLGQARPGHGGEVVVLVVVADVVGEDVERAVVAVGLGDGHAVVRVRGLGRDGLVDVVLGDEVAGGGVQAAGEEGGEQQVEQGLPGAGGLDEEGVEGELHDEVDEVHPGEGHLEDAHGTDGVEEDLEGAEEGFAEDGVEDDGFERGGEVGVEPVDAEGFVVREVVGLWQDLCHVSK